ncbi:MAG: carboxypeptidase-like regulatory domain-containing protein [Tidjanibacter sp.]|nr:carboxypeptidase-like regulatory domain-containing protein [Tidjanibacter sp.]
MKIKKLLNAIMFTTLLFGVGSATVSCVKEEPVDTTKGQIIGTVTDEADAPLAGVAVKFGDITATTGTNGKYLLDNVTIGSGVVSFSKTDYQTASVTLTKAKFNAERVATVDVELVYAAAKIAGTVTDASDAPMEGVTVSISESQTATTASDGKYEISNLVLEAYTVTFKKAGFDDVVKSVGMDQFVDNVATVDAVLGATQLLPGLTAAQLEGADKWLYNEYRGGRNGDDYPHWDWSVDNMCCLSFMGWWEEQNEGTTIQIQNSESDQASAVADLDKFSSYIYGSKAITADNKILTVRVRTHAADAENPAIWGVQVVDLSAAEPVAVKIGENVSYGSENYDSFAFDLSAYVGKEIVVAVGIYRAATGDYWKQVCLRRISFAAEKVEDWNWMPGTAIDGLNIDAWHMTQEIVRSTSLQTKTSFNGVSTVGGDRDNYCDAYRSWRENSGIGYEWSLMPVKKDAEPTVNEGFLIKTNGGGTPVNYVDPQAYFYAKFAIAAGKDKMTMKVRNFDSNNATFVKLTVIEEATMAVSHIVPTTTGAGEAVENCWKFINEDGDANNVENYLTLNYDLSAFDGKNVVLAVGVYKGEDNDGENKLVVYSIEFN